MYIYMCVCTYIYESTMEASLSIGLTLLAYLSPLPPEPETSNTAYVYVDYGACLRWREVF